MNHDRQFFARGSQWGSRGSIFDERDAKNRVFYLNKLN